MKVAILAGGLGTRLSEENETKPKPMVEIGKRPIPWHIMKHYSYYGFEEFMVALGYKGEVIKRYFLDYYRLNGSMTIDFSEGRVETHAREGADRKVHLYAPRQREDGRTYVFRSWSDDKGVRHTITTPGSPVRYLAKFRPRR